MQAEMRGGPIDGQMLTLGNGDAYYDLDEMVNGEIVRWRIPVTRWRRGPVLLWKTRERR